MPVVEGVMVSGNTGELGGEEKSSLAKLIEQAMADAVTQSYADGVHDPDQMRERILTARDATIEKYNAVVAEALSKVTQ